MSKLDRDIIDGFCNELIRYKLSTTNPTIEDAFEKISRDPESKLLAFVRAITPIQGKPMAKPHPVVVLRSDPGITDSNWNIPDYLTLDDLLQRTKNNFEGRYQMLAALRAMSSIDTNTAIWKCIGQDLPVSDGAMPFYEGNFILPNGTINLDPFIRYLQTRGYTFKQIARDLVRHGQGPVLRQLL